MKNSIPLRPRATTAGLPVAVACLLAGGLSGCAAFEPVAVATAATSAPIASAMAGALVTAEQALGDNEAVSVVDTSSIDASRATKIVLSGSSAEITGRGASVADGTVTINAGGSYAITGSIAGQIVVAAPEDAIVTLVLGGTEIAAARGPGIHVQSAGNAAIHLAEGSTNAVRDAAPADGVTDGIAAIASEADLTIAGTGSLQAEGTIGDGISSDDDLSITGGSLAITAADDALRGKDAVHVTGGGLTLNAGGDGITAANKDEPARGYVDIRGGRAWITAAGDGIAAEGDAVITGGELAITTGGGIAMDVPEAPQAEGQGQGQDAGQEAEAPSTKGVKAHRALVVEGGLLRIDALDDALHSDADLSVNEGQIEISSGDDAVHAEAGLGISGGHLTVSHSYEAIEGAAVTISGGIAKVTSSDDGVNAARSAEAGGEGDTENSEEGVGITISGGELHVDAAGDGLDANGPITVSGGVLTVTGPNDLSNSVIDANGGFNVTGGSIIATGTHAMAQVPSEGSAQGWLAIRVSGAPGALVQITDGAGTPVAEFAPAKNFETVLFSDAIIQPGAEYTVRVAGGAPFPVTAGAPFGGAA